MVCLIKTIGITRVGRGHVWFRGGGRVRGLAFEHAVAGKSSLTRAGGGDGVKDNWHWIAGVVLLGVAVALALWQLSGGPRL